MTTTFAQIRQTRFDYRGDFKEPIFGVLGNPALLYSSLLEHLSPYGAAVGSLSINLAVLADANVTCFLGSYGIVRVWIDRLEVSSETTQWDQLEGLLGGVWAAAERTDISLRPVRHTVTIGCWGELGRALWLTSPSVFPRELANLNERSTSTAGTGRGADGGSVHLAEAHRIPQGLRLDPL